MVGIDESTVCRVVNNFCKSLVSKKNRFIRFPFTDDEKTENKLKFYKMGGFPSCILCIDGFHGKICTPYHDENSFVNRKGFHSINVQAMTGADYRFTDVVVRWPGSVHDSFIFRTSAVYDCLRVNHTTLEKGVMLGDSGYALTNFLMTPYDNPTTRQERRFNITHKTTRSSVERSIGQLKRRFHGLKSGLRVQPEKACLFITACVILHNIAKMLNEVDFDGEDEEDYECDPIDNNREGTADGRLVREHITETFFR